MKIAVNTRLLLKDKLEGIGWVAYECLKRIVTNHPDDDFYFIFDREPDEKFIFAENVKPVVLFPQARHPFLYIAYFEFSVARFLRKLKPDLYLSTDAYLSLRSKTKQLAVFHDLNFEHFPQDFPKIHLWHYKKFFPKYAKKADRIITVSEFSKQDICKNYGIDPSKIDVVYNGANADFCPVDDNVKIEIRSKFSQGKPYFMFVGSLHPRKNLARLFTAFDIFKLNDKRYALVVKNGIIDSETRNKYLKELKEILDKSSKLHKIQYKITLIGSNEILGDKKKYVTFSKYLESKLFK